MKLSSWPASLRKPRDVLKLGRQPVQDALVTVGVENAWDLAGGAEGEAATDDGEVWWKEIVQVEEQAGSLVDGMGWRLAGGQCDLQACLVVDDARHWLVKLARRPARQAWIQREAANLSLVRAAWESGRSAQASAERLEASRGTYE